MDFSQFCSCGPSGYAQLKACIDNCAAQGRSYEFPPCKLPAGCVPGEARVGFWHAAGEYLLYFRPTAAYYGPSSLLADFWPKGDFRRFTRFEELAAALQGLDRDAAALRPGAPMPPEFLRLNGALQQLVLGQYPAVEAAAFKLYGHICKTAPKRPLSLIFYGPTCVGKSELAKQIVPALNRHLGEERYHLVWTELNTFTQAHSVYRLTGAPPGYVGYDDPPVLEAVREQPYSVFMFDELDKAHPEVLKIFMSILDEGRCAARQADKQGSRELDFRRCIFLFTTNSDLSAPPPRRLGFSASDAPVPSPNTTATAVSGGPAGLAQRLFQADEAARQALARSGVLREIAGRFSGLIGFQPLSADAKQAITARQIMALGREYGLEITRVDPVLAQAFTPEDALSLRSTVGVLEGALTALFLQEAQQNAQRGPLQLSGTAREPQLRPLAPEPRGLSLPAF